MKVGGREVEVIHLDKVLFPADGLTKGDVVSYYRDMAEVILPYLRDRPVNLQRFPEGVGGEGFYQKRPGEDYPDWIRRVTLPMEGGVIEQIVCEDAATLVYLANQNVLTLHPWLSKVDKPDHPDLLVFDLDPSDNDFSLVRQAALWIRDLLEGELDLPAFVKSTGSLGLHVAVPLDRADDFDSVRGFAQDVALVMTQRHPDLTAATRKEARKGRLFLDVARNAYAQTAVAPYSLRARNGAPAATPLEWPEVESGDVGPQSFTLATGWQRLDAKGDVWKGMHKRARSLHAATQKLEAIRNERAA